MLFYHVLRQLVVCSESLLLATAFSLVLVVVDLAALERKHGWKNLILNYEKFVVVLWLY